jgi:hypothetical protein
VARSAHSELKSSLVAGRLQKSAQTADVLPPEFKAENRVFEFA